MRVCLNKYPMGSYRYQKKAGFHLDDKLKYDLDILIKNIKNDWDFTIIISGGGKVRIGKSVLAQQIGEYITEEVKRIYGWNVIFDLSHNVCFKGEDIIQKGTYLGNNGHKGSCLIYDEAGADLMNARILSAKTQMILDYYRECGQYNLFNILVLPDFFDLPKAIALNRSILLINVTMYITEDGIFERGFYDVYSDEDKKKLYVYGKKYLNYNAVRKTYDGQFFGFYPLPETDYRELKNKAMIDRDKNKEQPSVRMNKYINWCCALIKLYAEAKPELTDTDIANKITQKTDDKFPIGRQRLNVLKNQLP